MPIKTDSSGKRWVEMELVVPGSPEQVWHAVATGPGNSAWFTKTEIEERVGGALRFDMGPGMESSGQVTDWEPPRLFGYVERDWKEGAPPVATEITVTARSGDKCVVRMTHSLFASTDDWDGELEGFEGGWPVFFDVLRIYLAQFPGAPGRGFMAMQPGVAGDALAAWKKLTELTGLAGADTGDRRSAAEPEAMSGVVAKVVQDEDLRYLVVRLEEPGPGVLALGAQPGGKGVTVSAVVFCYGDGAEARAEATEGPWRQWFETRFGGAG